MKIRNTVLSLSLALPLGLLAQEPLKDAESWIHGVAPGQPPGEPLQVHEAGPGTFILRENKSVNFEAPFCYLLLGETRALLLDTGAKPGEGRTWPIVGAVDQLIRDWEKQKPGRKLSLLVAHTHGHRDHRFADDEFRARPDTVVVGFTAAAVKEFFGFTAWPEGEAQLDLGGRLVTVLPIPGHEPAHLAFYDVASGTLFSGDTLYPGLLTVRDWPEYRRSVVRLVRFAEAHPVTAICGAHIEMTRRPREMYPLETPYQPEEHALFMDVAQLRELHRALEAQGDATTRIERDDFIVELVKP